LADEPTGNLDRKTGDEIVGLLKRSNRENRQTLILITHDEALAMEADRIIRIEDGRITKNERVRNLV
ncbi:MAG: ABC transporter ATP-binding protein, partial [Clostridia bacterium]|nr:ABC transporter ATP-binding protein [Clostridia bacterium]